MPRYVIYARKSTESEDRQVLSIDSQISELRAHAARQGLAVADVLTESRSAKAPGRPVFGQLMKEIRSGKVHGIVAWKMDRLARNHLDTGQVLQALADGLLERVVTIDRTYTGDGNDRFIGNFELGMATKFIDDLRQNVTRGMRAKFAQGWACFRPPIGYLNDRAAKTIVKDPERFDLVRRMWELMLTGTMRPEQVLRTATEQWGLRTRKTKRMGGAPLVRSALYRIYANPFYMGLIRLRSGQTFVGAHPPMVSREEFERLQELIGRPGRPRPKHHEFPFVGLLRCGACNASITAEEHVKPNGRRYVYYRCTRHKPGVVCREPALPDREIEIQCAGILERLMMPEAVYRWLLAKARRGFESERARRGQVRIALKGATQALKREEDTLLSLRIRELLTDEAFVAKRQELQERRLQLEQRLHRAAEGVEQIEQRAEATFTFAQKAKGTFLAGSAVQKRMILEAVGLNYTLRSRKVALELKKPFQLMAEASASRNWQTLWDDVRTWLQDTTEHFATPNFDALSTASTLPWSPTLD